MVFRAPPTSAVSSNEPAWSNHPQRSIFGVGKLLPFNRKMTRSRGSKEGNSQRPGRYRGRDFAVEGAGPTNALPERRTWWGQVGQGDAGRQVQLPQGLTTESLAQVRRGSQWKRGLLWSTGVGGAGKIFLSKKTGEKHNIKFTIFTIFKGIVQ